MKAHIHRSLLMVVILLLSACASTPKTEQQQYDEMRDSLSYRTLEQLSGKTVNPGLSLYNKQLKSDEHPEIHPELVHSLAAVIFAIGRKPMWATVEANLALEAAKDDSGRYVAYSALSIALYSNGWEGLGARYAAMATALENGASLDEKYKDSRLTAKVIVGIFAINQGDGEAAEKLFAELGTETGNTWLPLAAHGAAIAVSGPDLSTVSKLQTLASRSAKTIAEQQKLAEIQTIAEQNQDNPNELDHKTNALVKTWAMSSLESVGSNVKKSAIDTTLEMVDSLVSLVSFG